MTGNFHYKHGGEAHLNTPFGMVQLQQVIYHALNCIVCGHNIECVISINCTLDFCIIFRFMILNISFVSYTMIMTSCF
jgi:hypothetical protein